MVMVRVRVRVRVSKGKRVRVRVYHSLPEVQWFTLTLEIVLALVM